LFYLTGRQGGSREFPWKKDWYETGMQNGPLSGGNFQLEVKRNPSGGRVVKGKRKVFIIVRGKGFTLTIVQI